LDLGLPRPCEVVENTRPKPLIHYVLYYIHVRMSKDAIEQAAGQTVQGIFGAMEGADNTLVVDDVNAYGTLRDRLASARNAPVMWDGPGLGSLAAGDDVDGIHGLGIAIADFKSQISDTTSQSVIVKYTLNGDSDLNGVIDADDHYRMDVAYRLPGEGQHEEWANGDVDYLNGILADDFYLIDRAYVRQATVAGAAKREQVWSVRRIEDVW
jgi:hypothetical protein